MEGIMAIKKASVPSIQYRHASMSWIRQLQLDLIVDPVDQAQVQGDHAQQPHSPARPEVGAQCR